MAKTKKSSTAITKVIEKPVAITTELPDYLSGKERLGTETLGKEDFKVPRIKLLQPLSPEIITFMGKALPGEFWHTGANISLGSEFTMIPVIVGKRVVLWRPRDDSDGGVLAFSRDAINWQTGANQTFEVKIKGVKKPVKWSTGKNVAASGLLEFGTSNPDETNSYPAATLCYEYLAYLPDRPDLSPCVLGVYKTGIGNAKGFNTYLLMQRKPSACMAVRVFASKQQKGLNSWHVPSFDPAGFATKETFEITKKIAEQYEEYEVEIDQEDMTDDAIKTADAIKDEIPF